jgi:hypothetical protein
MGKLVILQESLFWISNILPKVVNTMGTGILFNPRSIPDMKVIEDFFHSVFEFMLFPICLFMLQTVCIPTFKTSN